MSKKERHMALYRACCRLCEQSLVCLTGEYHPPSISMLMFNETEAMLVCTGNIRGGLAKLNINWDELEESIDNNADADDAAEAREQLQELFREFKPWNNES